MRYVCTWVSVSFVTLTAGYQKLELERQMEERRGILGQLDELYEEAFSATTGETPMHPIFYRRSWYFQSILRSLLQGKRMPKRRS
jgi:hypothetical protein